MPRIGTRCGVLSFPDFASCSRKWRPTRSSLLAPPFLAAAREPGVVQIWSGYLARTAPGWSLLSRGPANIPRTQGYEHYEGIIESETWFGPLFTNVRLTRTNSPVEFHVRYPLFQVQPLLRQCYDEPSFEIVGLSELSADDWHSFEATMKPNTDQMRMLGHYAVEYTPAKAARVMKAVGGWSARFRLRRSPFQAMPLPGSVPLDTAHPNMVAQTG